MPMPAVAAVVYVIMYGCICGCVESICAICTI